jgi:hypothetical protein
VRIYATAASSTAKPKTRQIRTLGEPARREGRPSCEIYRDGNGDVFVLVSGKKIAKRGLPDTARAHTWIMLEPGWMVRDVKGGKAIEVRYERARMH